MVIERRESIWRNRDSVKPGLDDRVALLEYLEQRVWDQVIHAPRLLVGDISKHRRQNSIEEFSSRLINWRSPV